MATVNNLLQPQAQAAWRQLSTGEQLRAATALLDTVEQGAFVLADNLLKTDIVQENADNIRECRPRRSPRAALSPPPHRRPERGAAGAGHRHTCASVAAEQPDKLKQDQTGSNNRQKAVGRGWGGGGGMGNKATPPRSAPTPARPPRRSRLPRQPKNIGLDLKGAEQK